jgi:hypothetical protein
MHGRNNTYIRPAEAKDPLAGRSAAFKTALDAVERAGQPKAKNLAETGDCSGTRPERITPIRRDEQHRSPGKAAVPARGVTSGICS